MKNEVNRALAAKKYQYFQPEVYVASIAWSTLMQTTSPAGGNPPLYDVPTDDQW